MHASSFGRRGSDGSQLRNDLRSYYASLASPFPFSGENMSIHDDLERLVSTFPRDVLLARGLDSANPEDDLVVKAAVVGFSYNAPTAEWDLGHFDFLQNRLDFDYRDDELRQYGDKAINVKLFYALACGYLLGLYHQSQISDEEFSAAEQLIPGLIMFYLPQLTATAV